MLKYPAMIHQEDNGFWIEFPDIQGCTTEGDTMKELIENAEEALSLHLGVLFDYGKDIPEPSDLQRDDIIYINVEPSTAIPLILRKTRKERKLTQQDIAQRTGQKYQAYQNLENVRGFNARIKTLEKIAKALGKRLSVEFIDRESESISIPADENKNVNIIEFDTNRPVIIKLVQKSKEKDIKAIG